MYSHRCIEYTTIYFSGCFFFFTIICKFGLEIPSYSLKLRSTAVAYPRETMGRLDDAAKHKVVELRKAGLSFRKIKAVLELENIRVSAQAIYLFLREFQGRPPGRVRPAEAGTSSAQVQAHRWTARESWNNVNLRNLLQESTHSHHAAFLSAGDFSTQTSGSSGTPGNVSSSGAASGSTRSELQRKQSQNEKDIQIVSVTSLAQQSQQKAPQSAAASGNTAAVSSGSTPTTFPGLLRRRVTPSPATSSILAAKKRILDKALSHKIKVSPLMRNSLTNVQSSDLSGGIAQPRDTYHLTSGKNLMDGQPGGSSTTRRFLTQQTGMGVRSLPPRVGIRLPNRPPAPLNTSAPGGAMIRLQAPGSQSTPRADRNPSPQQTAQDGGGRGGLQDQIQTLGCEVRSLGVALKMLVEQQGRLEREQVQQTHVQKQILSTLQSIASKMSPCRTVPPQHTKTPSPTALPAVSASSSFSPNSFSFSQGAYPQCNQTQTGFSSLESLQNVDAFKLPELSPSSINGFPLCSNSESLPLSHTPPHSQSYDAYAQQVSQTHLPAFTQSYASTYTQSLSQTFRAPDSKTSDFSSSCSAQTFQDCSVGSRTLMNSELSVQDQQTSIIKVEGP
ncbi:uncharacterized protein LOC114468801 [Gouania willdenowi]|uniref:uncharacterized protein LOC114468801 n=1 Tax=Gouania willdenowi TaxID=441366 RepID=UPI001054522D|nr:uncharacterized protein LOC114468801 [Gouania willdenowi]